MVDENRMVLASINQQAQNTENIDERKRLIETMARYGEQAIDPLIALLSGDPREEIKQFILDIICELRQEK